MFSASDCQTQVVILTIGGTSGHLTSSTRLSWFNWSQVIFLKFT